MYLRLCSTIVLILLLVITLLVLRTPDATAKKVVEVLEDYEFQVVE